MFLPAAKAGFYSLFLPTKRMYLSRFRGMRNTPQHAAYGLVDSAPGYRAACRAVIHYFAWIL
jgi:hypothetical protein